TKSLAHFFCRSVPSRHSTWANVGPDAYIQIGALEPSTSSASDHQKVRGASVPPISLGTSRRQNSESMYAWKDFLNDAGTGAVNVPGSKTGGLRSPSV